MAVNIVHEDITSGIVEVHVSGKLTKEDYEHFVPEIESLIERYGCIRVLFEMHEFHGWTAEALWKDIRFDLKHFRDIERLAVIGEKRWQKGMAIFCKPFTKAKIRYFDQSETALARDWLNEEIEEKHPGAAA